MHPTPPRPIAPLPLVIQRRREQQRRDLENDWARPRPELDERWIQPPNGPYDSPRR